MNNRLLYPFLLLILFTSCYKDPTGNAITVHVSTNDTLLSPGIRGECNPGPPHIVLGVWKKLNYLGDGEYQYEIEKGYDYDCFTLFVTIPENNDSTGITKVNINAFYSQEGNVVGFQERELQRPHNEISLRYEIRVDTYVE